MYNRVVSVSNYTAIHSKIDLLWFTIISFCFMLLMFACFFPTVFALITNNKFDGRRRFVKVKLVIVLLLSVFVCCRSLSRELNRLQLGSIFCG